MSRAPARDPRPHPSRSPVAPWPGTPRRAGLLLAAVQTLLLLGLGAQLLLERLVQPRGWARTNPVDPELPIRGRYINLALQVAAEGLPLASDSVGLRVRDGRVVAVPVAGSGAPGTPQPASISEGPGGRQALLREPLAFFLPPQLPDPSQRPRGESLWVEVTLPRQGPPRPLQLGIERNGQLRPLALR